MVKVVGSLLVSLSQLEEKQIECLQASLSIIKSLGVNYDPQKKEKASINLSKALNIEKELVPALSSLDRSAQDYLTLTKDLELAQKIRSSLSFLTKYKIEEWLNKGLKYLEEGNVPLAIRTLEEELLDQNFGLIASRYEHIKTVEQNLPEEERNEALAYNSSLEKLREVLNGIVEKSETAQYKEGTEFDKLLLELKANQKTLFGKGFLWKRGVIPEIETHYKKDLSQLKTSSLSELSSVLLQSRTKSLSNLENSLVALSQLSLTLLENNISSTSEQLEYEKKNLAEVLTLFHTRAFNLIIPTSQRVALRQDLRGLSEYYNQLNKAPVAVETLTVSSGLPEFVYDYFQTMEDLAKSAKQKLSENNYKDAVLNLEEIYRITLRRDWERLKKIKESKAGDILTERNNEIKELVQVVRNVIRSEKDREKHFNSLIVNLEQTNQLLAAKKGQ